MKRYIATILVSLFFASPVFAHAQDQNELKGQVLQLLVVKILDALAQQGKEIPPEALSLITQILNGDDFSGQGADMGESDESYSNEDIAIEVELYDDGAWVFYYDDASLYEADYLLETTNRSSIMTDIEQRLGLSTGVVVDNTEFFSVDEKLGTIGQYEAAEETFYIDVYEDETIALYEDGSLTLYWSTDQDDEDDIIEEFSGLSGISEPKLVALVDYQEVAESKDEHGHFEEGFEGTEDVVAEYDVAGSEISQTYGDENSDAKQLWNIFVDVAGSDFLEDYVVAYLVFDDEDNDTLAYVEADVEDNNRWQIGVNLALHQDYLEDQDDSEARTEVAETMIHEFAHILNFNGSQVDGSVDEESCTTTFTAEGCPEDNSYHQLFIKEFWSPKDLKRVEDEKDVYREGEFVSEYAASSPGEDFAETFAFFVSRDEPNKSTLADEKIWFMYGIDELVTWRNDILERIEL